MWILTKKKEIDCNKRNITGIGRLQLLHDGPEQDPSGRGVRGARADRGGAESAEQRVRRHARRDRAMSAHGGAPVLRHRRPPRRHGLPAEGGAYVRAGQWHRSSIYHH